MSMVGKRRHIKSSDESQPSISPDSELTKMKGEFNLCDHFKQRGGSKFGRYMESFNSNQGEYESFK